MLALILAVVAIWAGLLILVLSALAAPLIAWWMNRNTLSASSHVSGGAKGASYKIIEAEYEIVDK